MLPTRDQMIEAVTWFCAQDPRPSAYYAARKFNINYDQLRGALVLYDECPAPKHLGRQYPPMVKEYLKNNPIQVRPRGRPKNPPLKPEQLAFLQEWVRRFGSFSVATQLNLGWGPLSKVLKGERGLGPNQLWRLGQRMGEAQ